MCHSHNNYEFSHSHNNNKLTGKRFVQSTRSFVRKCTLQGLICSSLRMCLNDTFVSLHLPVCIEFVENRNYILPETER